MDAQEIRAAALGAAVAFAATSLEFVKFETETEQDPPEVPLHDDDPIQGTVSWVFHVSERFAAYIGSGVTGESP